MVYPACSDQEWLVTEQELLPDHDFETERLHFDDLFERGMRSCFWPAAWFRRRPKASRQLRRLCHNQLGKVAECFGAFDFAARPRNHARAQSTPRTAEDRPGTRPRNPGSPDPRTLSRWHCLRNLGRKIAERHAALPGGQRLAKQIGPRFPGLDQDGTGPRSRASAESGKRHDLATGTTPGLADDGPVPGVASSPQRWTDSDFRPQTSDLRPQQTSDLRLTVVPELVGSSTRRRSDPALAEPAADVSPLALQADEADG